MNPLSLGGLKQIQARGNQIRDSENNSILPASTPSQTSAIAASMSARTVQAHQHRNSKICKLHLCLTDRGLDHCQRQCQANPSSYLLPIQWRQTRGLLTLDAITSNYPSHQRGGNGPGMIGMAKVHFTALSSDPSQLGNRSTEGPIHCEEEA